MNNFNCNAAGVNIELNVFYDTDVSQMYFDESIRCEGEDRIYVGCEYIPESWEKEISVNWNSINKPELKNIFDSDFYDSEKMLKIDICDELENSLNFDDLLEFCEVNSIEYDLNYFTVVTRGYSQGDYREVIMPYALAGIYGVTKKELQDQDTSYIDNLFWDAPIYARAEINGEEIYLDEALKDRYEWDRDEVITWINENVETGAAELIEMLPAEPKYL